MTALADFHTPVAPLTTRANGHQPIHPIQYAQWTEPKTAEHADVSSWWSVGRAVAPLVLVNGLAVYGQLAYVYDNVAPEAWNQASRVALAIGAAAAVESIALYVGWHAHDALLVKAHTTARNLRRASYLIAALVATVNYAHFAGDHLAPTAAAVMFGLVSLVSPWLWGLHSRRAQRIQLRKERRVDEAGAEFSAERRRHFPIRSWRARRWSIDHGVTDPREAWAGYNAERKEKAAQRAHAHTPTATMGGVQPIGPAQSVAQPTPKRSPRRTPTGAVAKPPKRQPTRRPAQPIEAAQPTPTVELGAPPTEAQSAQPTVQPTAQPTAPAQPNDGISDLQRQRLVDLAHEFPGDLPGRDRVMAHMREKGYDGWSSKTPTQTLIDLLRAQREAQPTKGAS